MKEYNPKFKSSLMSLLYSLLNEKRSDDLPEDKFLNLKVTQC